ncbi:MAG: nucleotidyltransferase family protein [Alphaproteobacteria bacterium]|nr:nucleotidyltransferase family protein [Alphaproteobacteria bacterium]
MRHKPEADIRSFFVESNASLRDAMNCINKGSEGIVLVVGADQRLLGTITDGDVRRWLLAGTDLKSTVESLLRNKHDSMYPTPLTAHAETEDSILFHMMVEKDIRHIPLIDDEERVVDLALLHKMTLEYELPITAVVMAGGFGTRLHPLTLDVPKPMLPLGDKPIMHRIVDSMKDAGVRRICVTTHYKPEHIVNYFGNGDSFGVEINYVKEDEPLGTAGALGLLERRSEPLLVMNGDIVTEVDYRAMHEFHKQHKADLTVAVRKYEFLVPYGVIEHEGSMVTGITEKPLYEFFVNGGIYLVEPHVLDHLPASQRFDMTELIQKVLDTGGSVATFPILEYWLDVGQHTDYQKAQDDIKSGRV